ncbi:hypothetical protein D9619_002328 [Psilocybe cf. subviscida]|uniref:Transposase n=1 Tax=Psilocybe cf. subviscida TaxID=2480587 RepID=A0A8H5AX29_9AGAR|nr:hypothetical protein D9619_002328 [Psilocybe cf. subviscida]
MPAQRSPKSRHSAAVKNQLVGAIAAGISIRQAARQFNIPRATANDIWQKFQRTGSTENLPKSGRPKKVTPRMERMAIRNALSERRKPFSEIANQCTPKISTSTVANILKRHNYHRRVARKVPYLNKAHRRARMAWARICKTYRAGNWRRKIWSDECYVHLGDNKGRTYVTRRPGEEYLEECCVATFTQSPIRVMVWACIMKGQKGPLVVMEFPGGKGGGINSKRYQEQILQPALKPFYRRMTRKMRGIQFQQDGAPSHRSKSTLRWLKKNRIPLFLHPSSSPDLNPIERVWHELKARLRAFPHPPTTLEGLKSAVRQIWDELPQSDIDKHIDGMDNRVQAILAAKGGHTRF